MKKEITFLKLKKNCRQDKTGMRPCKLAILGDCATQHLATAITGYGVEEQIAYDVFDADYNQIDAQLMDDHSEFFEFDPQFALIYMCSEKLYHTYCELEQKSLLAQITYEKIQRYWELIGAGSKAAVIQFTFAEFDDQVYGNYGAKTKDSFLYQVRKLNYLLMEGASEEKNVFLMDLDGIQSRFGRKQLCDDKMYYIAKMPISTALLPEVAAQVTDIIKASFGQIKKCVITDLDNTLWGGVIGDDGMEGIQIGELGLGHAFEELQLWLRELKNRGIILAVCSKNNEETAREPFEKHSEMILRMEDIAMFVANWEDKASNIRHIQETLNIGMDSIVFLDDNPFEREQVRSSIPEITVPELPEDPALYLGYLRSLNLFETISASESDKDRTKQYQAEAGRKISQAKYQSYDEYLQSLQMVAHAAPFDTFHYPRIAQLTQRSNQFNLRTVRYNEAQIAQLASDDHYRTLYFTLKDQFGDHGLISVAIMEKQDENTLFLTNWLMSCRVLKRGMEEFIINQVMECAKEGGFSAVIGEYLPTQKNAMVKDIYEKLGFTKLEDGRFRADVDTFMKNKTYIMLEKEGNE